MWGSDDDDDDDSSTEPLDWDFDFADLIPPTRPRYARHPYENGHSGYIHRVLRDDDDPIGRDVSGFATLETFYLGDRVYGPGFSLGVDYRQIGIESTLDWLVEGRLEDAMYLGSTNARFALVLVPEARIVAALGVQYMVDGRLPGQALREYALGPNGGIAMEVFPIRPVVASFRLDVGTLYQALSMKARFDVGVVLHGVGIFGGYQYRNIAGITLQGPTLGLRLWL